MRLTFRSGLDDRGCKHFGWPLDFSLWLAFRFLRFCRSGLDDRGCKHFGWPLDDWPLDSRLYSVVARLPWSCPRLRLSAVVPSASVVDSRSQDVANTELSDLFLAVAAAPAVPIPIELTPGTVINDTFKISRKLGAGGMGVVYKARDLRLGRDVALKLHRTSEREATLDRLLREAQSLARLTHPNVVTVHEVGRYRSHLFIAMEYIPGGTAQTWLSAQPRKQREILTVYIEAGRGLAAAHAAGLVHRDFKPDNVLISNDQRVCVADFGLARSVGDTAEPRGYATRTNGVTTTRAGTIIGTPTYMAPEQLDGSHCDERSDQFSFCATLYQALTGSVPFAGDTPAEIRSAMNTSKPNVSALPRRIGQAIERGLHIEPSDRHASMSNLLAKLQPRSRSTRAWIALCTAAAMVTGLAVFAVAQHDTGASCPNPDPTLSGRWSADQQQRLKRQFHRSSLSYAKDTWTSSHQLIDRYVHELEAVKNNACNGTRVRHDRSETMYDRQLACIRTRTQRLSALLTLWETADDTVIKHALRAVGRLPAVSACEDQNFLATNEPLNDPTTQALSNELDKTLSHGIALVDSGKLKAAKATLTAAAQHAESTTLDPLIARAQLARGRLQAFEGDYPGAENTFTGAFAAARRANLDALAGRIAAELVVTVSNTGSPGKEAHLWAQLAQIEVDRGHGGDELKLHVSDARARLSDLNDNFANARSHAEQALELATRIHGDDHPKVASALSLLGQVLDGHGDYDEALKHYERALAMMERIVGPEHPTIAGMLRVIGLINSDRGHYKAAEQQLRRGLAVAEKAFGPDGLETGWNALNLGVALQGQRKHDMAIEQFLRALTIVTQRLGPDHPDLSLCLNSLAVAYEGKRQFARALAYYQQALAIATNHRARSVQVAVVLANIAAVHYEMHQLDKALIQVKKSIRVWESIDPDNTRLAHPLTIRGESLVELHRYREALAPLERAAELLKGREVDAIQRGRTNLSLGIALWVSRRDRPRGRRLVQEATSTLEPFAAQLPQRLAYARQWLKKMTSIP